MDAFKSPFCEDIGHISITCCSPASPSTSVFLFLISECSPPHTNFLLSTLEEISHRLLHLPTVVLNANVAYWCVPQWLERRWLERSREEGSSTHTQRGRDEKDKGGKNRRAKDLRVFQGREGEVRTRTIERRDGGMWRERAGIWKLTFAGSAALGNYALSLSLPPSFFISLSVKEGELIIHSVIYSVFSSYFVVWFFSIFICSTVMFSGKS